LFRRAATYVNKILKGAKPADLPVEQSTKLEFIVKLRAAKQIGLTIPPNVPPARYIAIGVASCDVLILDQKRYILDLRPIYTQSLRPH